jgi:GntR family histidine utilization transcriptional repressor
MSATPGLTLLSSDTSLPLYQQIKNAIIEKIHSGEWRPGEKVPSENKLATDLGASRMTINRPLRELTTEGLLLRVPGLGTFVAEPPRQASLLELKPIAEEIAAMGRTHHARVLSLAQIKTKQKLAELMGVQVGSTLFHIVVVHYRDELPIQLETRHVNPTLVPEFLGVDFTRTTPSEYLISRIRADELEHIVQAMMPDKYISERLSIPMTEPCLRLKRRTWKDNLVVTAVDLIYPSSLYDLGARYRTPITTSG